MLKHNIRRLPVLDAKKRHVGIVCIRDFVQDREGEDE